MENERQTATIEAIADAIQTAARDAAEAAIDAHGEPVAADIAWDFVQQVCYDTDGEVYGYMATLPSSMPRQFEQSYEFHCRAIMLENQGSITNV